MNLLPRPLSNAVVLLNLSLPLSFRLIPILASTARHLQLICLPFTPNRRLHARVLQTPKNKSCSLRSGRDAEPFERHVAESTEVIHDLHLRSVVALRHLDEGRGQRGQYWRGQQE